MIRGIHRKASFGEFNEKRRVDKKEEEEVIHTLVLLGAQACQT